MRTVFFTILTLIAFCSTSTAWAERWVITDVRIVRDNANYGNGYTPLLPLAGRTPGFLGLEAQDMNEDVNGPEVFVYAKYERRAKGATRVLVDLKVTDWGGDWDFPGDLRNQGYEPPTTIGELPKGALTPGSISECQRMGMAVKYIPNDDLAVDTPYVEQIGLAITPNEAPSSNSQWKVLPDAQLGCGSNESFNFFFRKTTLGGPTETDDVKAELIKKYSPHLYFIPGYQYGPSSVEFFQQHVNLSGDHYVTKQALSSPSDHSLTVFKGQDLSQVPLYAFWTLKPNGPEIVYYIFYPYNRGKEDSGTVWGNHVGDWEHVTVRLNWDQTPREVFYATHDEGFIKSWGDVEKKDGTHPVGYVARGSHATYPTPGNPHQYKLSFLGRISPFRDYTAAKDAGILFAPTDIKMWNLTTTRRISPTLGGADFPSWLKTPIRWGNPEAGCFVAACRLEDGPTGPLYKSYMADTFKKEGK